MSNHTLGVVILALTLVNIGAALGLPKDPRPWTAHRQIAFGLGLVQFAFVLWLAINVA